MVLRIWRQKNARTKKQIEALLFLFVETMNEYVIFSHKSIKESHINICSKMRYYLESKHKASIKIKLWDKVYMISVFFLNSIFGSVLVYSKFL